jgi:hypothetical protein
MDAKDHAVISVLGDQRRFMVPIYQRQYSWRSERLIPFWEDVVAKAQESLESNPKFKHYMGALIIAPGADGYVIGATPKVQVVDGQQRLTTFQIFLVALREVAVSLGFNDVSESVQNYLFNRPMSGDLDPTAKYKLAPTPEDRASFHLIVEGGMKLLKVRHPDWFYQNGNLKVGQVPLSVRALQTFIDKITDYVLHGLVDTEEGVPTEREDTAAQQIRLNALLTALLNHLKLVVITLDESDDAQVIFETLNSKAEPLLAMDLVRNNIFHRAEAQGEKAEDLFDAKWRPLDSDFWKADSPRAKPKRPRIDHFLSHALTAQTGDEISLRELYAEYRAFARPRGNPRFATVSEELDALLRFAPIYETLETQQGETMLAWLGRKLAIWEVATAYPLIFCVAVSDAPQAEKEAIYRLVYSYVVRRAICGLMNKSLNKNFQRMVSHLLKNGVSVGAFTETFARQTGPNVRFPSDDEVMGAVKANQIYKIIGRSERIQDILWELELRLRTKFNVPTPRPDSMSIEHIMPQTWPANWPLSDGRVVPADKMTGADETMLTAVGVRDRALHTLGNLTLVTVPANTVASNSAFERKSDWLKQSLLAMNLEIIEQSAWNETAIDERAARIAKLAIEIWPSLPVASNAVEGALLTMA